MANQSQTDMNAKHGWPSLVCSTAIGVLFERWENLTQQPELRVHTNGILTVNALFPVAEATRRLFDLMSATVGTNLIGARWEHTDRGNAKALVYLNKANATEPIEEGATMSITPFLADSAELHDGLMSMIVDELRQPAQDTIRHYCPKGKVPKAKDGAQWVTMHTIGLHVPTCHPNGQSAKQFLTLPDLVAEILNHPSESTTNRLRQRPDKIMKQIADVAKRDTPQFKSTT